MENNGIITARSGADAGDALAGRPAGTSLLHSNTIMAGSWIEREHANVTRQLGQHGRIVNNVTMAMPHMPASMPPPRLPLTVTSSPTTWTASSHPPSASSALT